MRETITILLGGESADLPAGVRGDECAGGLRLSCTAADGVALGIIAPPGMLRDAARFLLRAIERHGGVRPGVAPCTPTS